MFSDPIAETAFLHSESLDLIKESDQRLQWMDELPYSERNLENLFPQQSNGTLRFQQHNQIDPNSNESLMREVVSTELTSPRKKDSKKEAKVAQEIAAIRNLPNNSPIKRMAAETYNDVKEIVSDPDGIFNEMNAEFAQVVSKQPVELLSRFNMLHESFESKARRESATKEIHSAKAELMKKESIVKKLSRLGNYYSWSNSYYFTETHESNLISLWFLTNAYSNPLFTSRFLEAQQLKSEKAVSIKIGSLAQTYPLPFYININDNLSINDVEAQWVENYIKRLHISKIYNGYQSEFHQLSLVVPKYDLVELLYGVYSDSKMQFLKKLRKDVKEYLNKNVDEFYNCNQYSKVECIRQNFIARSLERFNAVFAYLHSEVWMNEIFEPINLAMNLLGIYFVYDSNKSGHKNQQDAIEVIKASINAVHEKIYEKSKEINSSLNNESKTNIVKKSNVTPELKKLRQIKAEFEVALKKVSEYLSVFYPSIVQMVTFVKNAYAKVSQEVKSKEILKEKGGAYTCLSFMPIQKVDQNNQVAYECLVAISGLAYESDKEADPLCLFADITNQIPALTLHKRNFTYRFVNPNMDNTNFSLSQIAKGLSGHQKPVSVKQTELFALPEAPSKACAEKRLTTELVELFKDQGSQVKILGCDNIALPTKVEETTDSLTAQEFIIEGRRLIQTYSPLGNFQKTMLKAKHVPCCENCQRQKMGVMCMLSHAQEIGVQRKIFPSKV